MRSFVLVALLGCGSSAPKTDPAIPAADPAPCAGVAANVVQFLDAAVPKDQVKALLEKHCLNDKWSVDLRKCIITGKSEKDLDGCEQYFVGDQMRAFKRDLEALAPVPPSPANGSDVPPAANTIPK